MPKQVKNIFPKIDEITEEFDCKKTQANIENEEGYFYGSVSKQTGLPSGEGVFVTANGWVHCGVV